MLSKKIFEDGISELVVVFNFSMTKTRAEVWYKYSKNISDSKWQKKIANCIKGCRKIPTLADILDIKGYYSNNPKEYTSEKPRDYEWEPVSNENQEILAKMKEKVGIKSKYQINRK